MTILGDLRRTRQVGSLGPETLAWAPEATATPR